jgi:hypothetical protein
MDLQMAKQKAKKQIVANLERFLSTLPTTTVEEKERDAKIISYLTLINDTFPRNIAETIIESPEE